MSLPGGWRRPPGSQLRGSRARPRPDQASQGDSGAAVRHRGHRARRRRDRNRCGRRRFLHRAHVRARRAAASAVPLLPRAPLAELPEVLSAFVTQYYLERESPAEIIVERDSMKAPRWRRQLGERAGHKSASPPRSAASAPLGSIMMHANRRAGAQDARSRRGSIESSLEELREAFDLDEAPRRIECSTSATRAAPTRWLMRGVRLDVRSRGISPLQHQRHPAGR